MASRHSFILILLLLCGCGDGLRLNQMQVRGTIASYRPTPQIAEQLGIDFIYTHRPLADQLGVGRIRQLDLEVSFERLTGNLYVHPGQGNDRDLTQCDTLTLCLDIIADWSTAHRAHHALVVLIRPNGRDDLVDEALPRLEEAIRLSFERRQIITPAEVSNGYPNLRDAIAERGWPLIELTRGRTMFVLHDRGRTREAYLSGHSLDPAQPRVMFTLADSHNDPNAGFFSFGNVSVVNQPQVLDLVRRGFLVIASVYTPDAADFSIDAGVHFLATPYPDRLLPRGRIEGWPTACNPITTEGNCEPNMIEAP